MSAAAGPKSDEIPPVFKNTPIHKKILLSLTAVVSALLVCELFLRITNIIPMFPGLTEKSALMGWEYIPNVSVLYNSREFNNLIKINSLGFRGPEISVEKPSNSKRIIVIGDSFVAGLQVSDRNLLTAKLQQNLSQKNGGAFEVVNFGMSGYGLDQKYLSLKEKALAFKPDLIIVFISANDINDVRENNIVTVGGGKLEFKKFPADSTLIKISKRLIKKSYIANAIYVKLVGPQIRAKGGAPLEVDVAMGDKGQKTLFYMDILKKLLVLSKETTDSKGVDLLVVLGADYVQTNKKLTANLKGYNFINEELGEFASAKGIEYIDLLPKMRAAVNRGENLYFPQNQHWNEAGHRYAAEMLTQYLKSSALNKKIEPR